ncbi:MAG: translation initiation factor IF-2 [Candidatus Delongbacteria bacterium]|jgi:translation initiation factor IF-2|nr:translation initiation factor IF-2 [Candidatus Delongbacteria bacterium]
MKEGKKRQVIKIAKELNLTSNKILDFLSKELNLDTGKGILTKIKEDEYVSVLKKFSISKYNDYTKKVDESEMFKANMLKEKETDVVSRISELDDILSMSEETIEANRKERKSKRRIKKEDSPAVEVKPITDIKEEDKKPSVNEETRESTSRRHVRKVEEKKDLKSNVNKDDSKAEPSKAKVAPSSSDKVKDFRKEDKKPFKKDKKAGKPKTAAQTAEQKEKEQKEKERKDSLKRKKHKNNFVQNTDFKGPRYKRKKKKHKVDKEQVKDSIKDTLNKMKSESKSFKKMKRKRTQENGEEIEVEVNVLTVSEFISTSELANKLEVDVSDIIAKCFSLGMMMTINQRLDKEVIELIATEYEFEVEFESEYEEEFLLEQEEITENMTDRHPVVTVMGHVDHGKTSLIDYLRKTKVAAGESGGITQHIGAYVVSYKDKKITFLDTPGHEAFTAMRSRGAKITDIVIIIIAADDRVNAQTNEAIDHALLAQVPIIFAINKIDKPNADPEKIKTQLSQRNILVEDWGGKYQSVELSAKTGEGVEDILEAILLEAEMIELKADHISNAKGSVIESKLDKGLGPVSTILVQRGTLRVGDIFVCGQYSGKVRAMLNERKEKVKEAAPGYPVVVLGFSGTPNSGDTFIVVDTEQEARSIASKRSQINRAHAHHKVEVVTLDQVSNQIKLGDINSLNVILKGDVDGSLEAISDSIMKLSNDEVAINILSKGVGAITEGDILLAEASSAVILGFHIRPNIKAKELALNKKIEIRLYSIIYNLIEDMRNALEGLLKPLVTEELLGTAEVRDLFKVPKMGTIAGCYVTNGKVIRNAKLKLIRDNLEIYQGKLSSLRRMKDDAKEVLSGFECGIGIEKYNDFKIGDIIEVFELKETQRTLD